MTAINPHAVRVVSDLRGVSVSQLAREADLDRSSLSTALNGGPRRIPADKLLDIARVLMVDPRALLGPETAPPSTDRHRRLPTAGPTDPASEDTTAQR